MSKKQRRDLLRIVISAALYLPLLVLEHTGALAPLAQPVQLALFLVPYLLAGYDVLWRAARNISRGQVFDENFLMLLATVGAFATGEAGEAVAVMVLYQTGELFQSYAVGKSRQSISSLMEICPEYANVERDGQLVRVDPDEVAVGSEICILPGERIPLDGVVTGGESMLDTAALTGESVPRRVRVGDSVISGCLNGAGALHVRTTKAFEDSTVTRILDLVENAGSRKAKTESFITRFARYYTPAVTIAAALLALVPPLFFGGVWSDWIQRACSFLVISCPCALVISVPMGFFGGIGSASKNGILIKGSNYLEAMAEVTTLVFDKTGTLTRGEFRVTAVSPSGCTEAELLELAALGEQLSTHPIAVSIREAYAKPTDSARLGAVSEVAGCGIRAQLDGRTLLLGNAALMQREQVVFTESDARGATIVYVALDGQFRGSIAISDTEKDGVKQALDAARQLGVRKCVMLTGDRRAAAEAAAARLGIDEVHAELLPDDKVACVERLLAAQPKGGRLAFVGDGINDAPVLSRADVGIAMGSMGADAAIEAADIVLMDDSVAKIPTTVRIARRTLSIVRQNIVFALAVKAVVLLLGALGRANMWVAVFADVGVAMLAILNSMRTLRGEKTA